VHRPRLLRRLALILALLHLMVPPLATIADARVERDVVRSGHPTVHVESHGSPKCPRIHPTGCGLCQVVATLATPPRSQHVPPLVARAVVPPVAQWLGERAAAGSTPALPRAPPIG